MIKVGVVCSSGGSVFGSAFKLLKTCDVEVNAAVVTDRECGVESLSSEIGVPYLRIVDPDRDSFSKKAAEWLYNCHGVEWTVLFFSRLIGAPLYSKNPCINFHPSLLPSFQGFGALNGALKSGVKFFGATAHLVDHSVDGGKILAQVTSSLAPDATLAKIRRVSFAQKLYLFLVMCEYAEDGNLTMEGLRKFQCGQPSHENYANPSLRRGDFKKALKDFINNEGIDWP
jgi:folate-dependent phosphoribosylglycinamide formyltransferase PurN